jgi:2-C-methyl-D-erythritol 4-phosphate cytidylyltransferase/2-C-methyl-D-erythritol 2,4-cyclodiphosphate synthase
MLQRNQGPRYGRSMRTVALVVAAGRGVRAGGGLPKQYRALAGEPVLRRALRPLLRHPGIDAVGCVIGAEDRALYAAATHGLPLLTPALGRATRQGSVRAGLEALPAGVERVLIHDAARPLVPAGVISRVLDALDSADGALPVLPVPDTLVTDAGAPVPRDGLNRAQTPQGFRLGPMLAAHRAAPPDSATDDAGLARAAGLEVVHVAGDERAMKLTTADDFATAEAWLAAGLVSRTGTGFDVHRFGPGDHVMLGGLRVPHVAGVEAHSDGDVALHALTDALLGAAGLGDIGQHFPPTDERWRGASSDRFLAHACTLVRDAGGIVDHLDVTIICERPKVGPHREAIRAEIARIAGLSARAVSVKATTTEGLGFTGRAEGIAAQAAATVRMPWDAGDA